MKVTYQITKKLQKELTAKDLNAERCQDSEINNKEVAEIIKSHPGVEMGRDGSASFELSKRCIFTEQRKMVYATDEKGEKLSRRSEVAGRNVYHVNKESYLQDKHFDYLINDAESLKKAIAEIESDNEKTIKEAEKKTAAELAVFPEKIEAFHLKHLGERC